MLIITSDILAIEESERRWRTESIRICIAKDRGLLVKCLSAITLIGKNSDVAWSGVVRVNGTISIVDIDHFKTG
jgi:hypothetical protein